MLGTDRVIDHKRRQVLDVRELLAEHRYVLLGGDAVGRQRPEERLALTGELVHARGSRHLKDVARALDHADDRVVERAQRRAHDVVSAEALDRFLGQPGARSSRRSEGR